jgi:4-amino-4-deoxy-L-arabinose transferase-like glycosyltransferase
LRPNVKRALVVSIVLLSAGQAFLLAIADLTRANGTFARSVGIGIITPDSAFYLGPSGMTEILQLSWTRWGYPLLLAAGPRTVDAVSFAVLVNGTFLLTAGYALFRQVEDTAGSIAAVAATAVLLLNPMTAQWLRIVMTESVFFATVVAATVLGHQLLDGSLSRFGGLLLFVVAVFAVISRPNGFLIAASLLMLSIIARSMGKLRLGLTLGLWVAALPVLLMAHSSAGPPGEGSIASQLYNGVVIEGADHVRTTIAMPPASDPSDDSVRGAVVYAVSHPLATARLGLTRLIVETLQVRRHYPLVVNVGFGSAIVLFFCAIGFGWRDPRSKMAKTVFLAIGIPLGLLTMATFAVAEARYGWAYLLPLAPIAGIGVDRAASRLLPSAHAILTRSGNGAGQLH